MKTRAFTFCLFIIVIAALSSCVPGAGKTEILTSFYPVQILTLNVTAGIPELAPALLLSSSSGCPHDYNLTPSDMEKISRAKVFIISGPMEYYFIGKVRSVYPNLKVINAGLGASDIPERGTGPKSAVTNFNPHAWVSPYRAAMMAADIAEALIQLYPKYEKKLRANTAAFTDRLVGLGSRIRLELQELSNHTIITFHDSFDYFAKDMGLTVAGIIETEPGIPPSARHMSDLARLIKEKKIKTIYAEEQYPEDIAITLANETGAELLFLDSFASGTNLAAGSYENAMLNNLAALSVGLK